MSDQSPPPRPGHSPQRPAWLSVIMLAGCLVVGEATAFVLLIVNELAFGMKGEAATVFFCTMSAGSAVVAAVFVAAGRIEQAIRKNDGKDRGRA
jgi:hypothetical protein